MPAIVSAAPAEDSIHNQMSHAMHAACTRASLGNDQEDDKPAIAVATV